MLKRHQVQPSLKGHPQIKNIIAVASGKGGVGKSTTSTNIAIALQQQGYQVGLLDADIYGPSQPTLLKRQTKPDIVEQKFKPIEAYGLHTMSIGYLVNTDDALIWRGAMVTKALQQMLSDTAWPELDILVVDLPPGTGDIQLTLSQKIPVAGAVIVTTPQDLALADVKRAHAMLNKVNINTLGIIENMSMFHCPQCGHAEPIFGAGGAARYAEKTDLALLGAIPLSTSIQSHADQGIPIVHDQPKSEITQIYRTIAEQMLTQLCSQPKDYGFNMPGVIVE